MQHVPCFQLGRLETPLGSTAEAEAREQEVKNYLTGRINELVAACQCAETRAGTLAAEVSSDMHLHGLVTGKDTYFLISSDVLISNVGTKILHHVLGVFFNDAIHC
jgi:hypothetical protein